MLFAFTLSAQCLTEGCEVLSRLSSGDVDARRRLQQIWNMGHKRGAQISLQLKGRRKLISLYAPMLAAGVGSFLAPTQKSRTFNLEMEPYTQETKPEREYDDSNVEDLNCVYSFLRHWAAKAELDPGPRCPPVSFVGLPTMYAACFRSLTAVVRSGGSALAKQ